VSLVWMLLVAHAGSPAWERARTARAEQAFVLPSAENRMGLSGLCADLVRFAPLGAVPDGAAERAETLGYRLEQEGDRVWLTDASGTGGVLVGVRLGPLPQELILQAPHPYFDLHTGKLASALYDEHDVRVVVLSLSHRELAEGSDAAHSPGHALTAATLGLTHGLERPLVVQLHGFGMREGRDAAVYLSGGQTWWSSDELGQAMETLSVGLGGVVVAQGDASNGLAGRTNTQGRLLAGRGRLLLVELDRGLRDRLLVEDAARVLLGSALATLAASDGEARP